MEMNLNKVALITSLALGLSTIIPHASLGASLNGVVIDASKSGVAPTISYSGNNPFFFGTNNPSALGGPSTVTSIGPNAWDIRLLFAGGDFASFGSSNRGLDLVESGTGKLLDSFSFNGSSRNSSTDLVVFGGYLYTADASGNPASESARCPILCVTEVYSGQPQLVLAGMSTAYTTFDVYLIGTAPNAKPVPSPSSIFGIALASLGFGVVLNRKLAKANKKKLVI